MSPYLVAVMILSKITSCVVVPCLDIPPHGLLAGAYACTSSSYASTSSVSSSFKSTSAGGTLSAQLTHQ